MLEELSGYRCTPAAGPGDVPSYGDNSRLHGGGLPQQPVTSPLRGVGRKDPCPCGSGKEYKKCCLP